MGSLEGYWRLVSGFFHYGQHLLEFSEVLKYRNASLGDSIDNASFSSGSLFHKSLLDQEFQVFFEYAAVNVGFVHDVSEL